MPRRPRELRPVVERKIYFYRGHCGLGPAGRPLIFNHRPVLEHIAQLSFADGAAYLPLADGNATCCWAEPRQDRLRLGTVRRSGLPQLEERGRLQPLVIPTRAGLAEQIHVVFFGHNVVGSEFNFYGPRLSRLSDYFSEKAEGIGPDVRFEPLLRLDVLEQLRRLRDVRQLTLRVRPTFAETIRRAERSLGDAVAAAREAGDTHEVELILRARPRSGDGLGARIRNAVLRLAREADVRTEASRFAVRGYDPELGRVEEIDILRDQFIATKRIVRQDDRTRALDSSATYAAITDAYQELRDDLNQAASVQIQ